ncbi:MAG: hypothetical protein LPK08_16340 [Halomonas sp.]|uniref:Uncharacterized protein n=2 Tax=Halomonadaceae TaxID=28256 RepID=A0ABS6ZR45_9GAMM|nr:MULTISPECIES: hypothetical protein [Halomonas]MBW6392536.1 hypothetical protein [Halomonas antri]MDX5379074.1 hypothetical protein [Halomonas sp.]QTP57278.1 hypothetical protein HNO53_00240 [Halomonas sulfidivorans]
MNLERAYILLAVFYSVLVAIGVIALLVGGGPIWGVATVGLGALVAAGLWGHTTGKPVMNPRMWRPLAGILAAAFVVQFFAVFALHPPGAELAWLLTGAIFSVLPAIMLFQYGKRDQEVWATPEEREGGKMLDDLLSRQRELVLEKQEVDRQATVKLTKAGNAYRASVTRGYGGQVERFEESFTCPATLAFFVLKYTCISVKDIAAQYDEERVLTT